MRRFRFRLTPVLRLRTQLERAARRDLAQGMAELVAIDQRLAAATQGLRDCADQAAATTPTGLLARALEQGLRRHRWTLQQQQQKAQTQVERLRADYAARERDARILRKLRDTRRAEWLAGVRKAEQAELDELATLARANAAAGHDIADGGKP